MTLVRLLTYFIGIGALFFLDRISKIYALTHYLDTPFVVNRYLCFVTEFNQGSSLGILSGSSYFEQVILLIGPIIPLGMICMYHCNKNSLASLLIIAGGVSNLYDRIVYSGVIDFILLSVGSASFPLFNLADLSISFGVMLLLYQLFYDV
jgi:signal peptidase II